MTTSRDRRRRLLVACVLAAATVPLWSNAPGGDWTDWRGPTRDGVSEATGLPDRWELNGEHMLWRVPIGARSAPVVMGDHVFLQNGVGAGATLQERVMALDADTGAVVWEHRFNVYHSDVPPHRVGWPSPTADPETAQVYAHGVGGTLVALAADSGRLVWERSLGQQFGLVTTHGGRTVSPVVEGELVIVSGLNSGWGDQARGAHRFFAFDKRTGDLVWVSSPGGRPYDTTYSPPVVTEIAGQRVLVAGAGDGAVHALKLLTGEPVWRYEMSKRGVNTGALVRDGLVVVSHGEENLDTSEMGMIAVIDGSAPGELGAGHVRWRHSGILHGFSSPVFDGERIYQMDISANLRGYDFGSGRILWTVNLGTIQRASPVFGDGKLYVGSENGKFYIVRPGPDTAEILSDVQLGTEEDPEHITGSAAVAHGRIYFASQVAAYAIGPRTRAASPARASPPPPAQGSGPVAHVQVVPAEVLLAPGERVSLRVRLFDAMGRLLPDEAAPAWALDGLRGTMQPDGTFIAPGGAPAQAGIVRATVDGVSGRTRVRVVPPLPWQEDFESIDTVPAHWINATGKYEIREMDGAGVLVKLADNPFTKRARVFMGPDDWSDYTVEADAMATERRRQMGDVGLVAQRYQLTLFGSRQRLEIHSWQPETERSVTVSFTWKPDTWYRMKLRTENLADGRVLVRGKVWERGQPEPGEWTIEKVDAMGNRTGSPGIYADAPFEVFFDNLAVTSN